MIDPKALLLNDLAWQREPFEMSVIEVCEEIKAGRIPERIKGLTTAEAIRAAIDEEARERLKRRAR